MRTSGTVPTTAEYWYRSILTSSTKHRGVRRPSQGPGSVKAPWIACWVPNCVSVCRVWRAHMHCMIDDKTRCVMEALVMPPAYRLLLALAAAAAPSVSVAPLQRPACEQCIVNYVAGEDAGAYKDIHVDGCDGPCDCSAVGSPCFDPKVGAAMKVGSVENQAACCALCTATKGCVGWVIPSGESAGTTQDDKPFCWVKHEMAPINKAKNRAHGTCAPNYSCPADWGFSFLVSSGLCVCLYVGGGSVFGARTSGRAPSLRAHPHHSHWVDAASLVSDGAAFARAVVQGRSARGIERQRAGGGSYGPVRDHSREVGDVHKQRAGEKSKGKRTQKKSDRKEKIPKNTASTGASGSTPASGSEAAESLQPVAAPVVAAVAGTKAGDGGRW